MYKDRFIKIKVSTSENKNDDITKPYYFLIDNIAYLKENSTESRTVIKLNDGSKFYTTTRLEPILEEINNRG